MGYLKQFVSSEAYLDFKTFLEGNIKLLHMSLEAARSHEDVCRLQGQIFALRKLQNLKEEILKRGA